MSIDPIPYVFARAREIPEIVVILIICAALLYVLYLINAHHPWLGGVSLYLVLDWKMAQRLASLGTRLVAKSVTSAQSEFLDF